MITSQESSSRRRIDNHSSQKKDKKETLFGRYNNGNSKSVFFERYGNSWFRLEVKRRVACLTMSFFTGPPENSMIFSLLSHIMFFTQSNNEMLNYLLSMPACQKQTAVGLSSHHTTPLTRPATLTHTSWLPGAMDTVGSNNITNK